MFQSRNIFRLLAALFGSLLINTAFADTRVIHAGTLLAVPGKAPVSEQTVVIENGMISQVPDGYQPAADFGEIVELIDLKNSFVMPGLMDMHVHLQTELGPTMIAKNCVGHTN